MTNGLLILAALATIVIIAAAARAFLTWGPDLSKYESLKEPRISDKPDQRMLVVEAAGNPNKAGPKAFKSLFRSYYKAVKGGATAAPRARWPKPLDTPMDEWVGFYGLPVPDAAARLPDSLGEPGFRVSMETWSYGKVAEILHIGPYSTEKPTIERLKKFISDNGCQISGPHEEEYLKGPGMFGPGNPERYHTIIRYQIRIGPGETAADRAGEDGASQGH